MAYVLLKLVSEQGGAQVRDCRLSPEGGSIGRSESCDWTLLDTERFVSKEHCRITFQNNQFSLTDTSTNGVYINSTSNLVGRNNQQTLSQSDIIIIGEYKIQVQAIELDSAPNMANDNLSAGGTSDGGLLDLVMGQAPSGAAPSPAQAFDPLAEINKEEQPNQIPDNGLADLLATPIKPDYTSTPSVDSFQPETAKVEEPVYNQASSIPDEPKGASGIPDDWELSGIMPAIKDFELPGEKQAEQVPEPASAPEFAPNEGFNPEPPSFEPAAPVNPNVEGVENVESAPQPFTPVTPNTPENLGTLGSSGSDILEPVSNAQAQNEQIQNEKIESEPASTPSILEELAKANMQAPQVSQEPVAQVIPEAPQMQTPPEEPVKVEPVASHVQIPEPVVAPVDKAVEVTEVPASPAPAAQVKADAPVNTVVADDFLNNLYEKLGLPKEYISSIEPEVFAQDIADVMMSTTQGLMSLLNGRTVFKQESRLSLTSVQPRSNNPIKFSIDPSDTLEMLLLKKKKGYLSAQDAYEEAVKDLQLHQMAFLSGLQATINGVLDEVSPAKIEQQVKDQGRTFMGLNQGAQCWQTYKDKQEKLQTLAKQNLNEVLSTYFADAYQSQIDSIKNDIK